MNAMEECSFSTHDPDMRPHHMPLAVGVILPQAGRELIIAEDSCLRALLPARGA